MCSNGCKVQWKSQPEAVRFTSQGNLDIVSAITFAGIPVAKFIQFSWLMNLKFMHDATFYRIRNSYIAPVIRKHWKTNQDSVLQELKQCESVYLIGDGRHDSPGHNAKFGTYTLMDSVSGKVVESTVMSVCEVMYV